MDHSPIGQASEVANFTINFFDLFEYFTTKLHNFTKFRKLSLTVLKLFSNLKVCVFGEWSIKLWAYVYAEIQKI